MAYVGGLCGWSGGGRRPLTYNLMPGQMRNTRVNVFQNNYMMPMGACYYADPCQCNQDDGMPKWMQWMMGGGMVMQLLGGIASGIWGGGGSEGAGGASKKTVDAENDLASMQREYKDTYTISKRSDGTVRAKNKKTGEIIKADTPTELWDLLDEASSKKTTTTTTTVTKHSQSVGDGLITGLASTYKLADGAITYDATTGKFKYDGREYSYDELKTYLAANPPAANNAAANANQVVAASGWTQPTSITKLTDTGTSPLNIPAGATTNASSEMGANITSAPKTYEIKSATGAILYKFELVDDTSKLSATGEPKYVCTFANRFGTLGTNKQQEYFLNSDGQMYQKDANTIGTGIGLGKVVP